MSDKCGCDNLPWARQGLSEVTPSPTHGIMFPNRRDLAAPSASVPPAVFDLKHPCVLESINAQEGGFVFAWPRESGSGALTQREVYEATSHSDGKIRLLVPFPGIWQVQADALAAGPYKVLDVCNPAAALAFGGVRVIGGSVAPAAQPLTFKAPTFATVGVASGNVLGAEPLRRFVSFHNTDLTKTIYLADAAFAAVVGSGIAIPPQSFRSFNEPGEDLTRGAFTAIATGAGTNLAIQEAT